jgi:hypothetical protein
LLDLGGTRTATTSLFDIPIPDTPEPEVSPTERAFHIIEMTAQLGRVTTSDIVTALGIPKTTAHRLVSNLEDFGFLEHGMERGRYQVGPRLLELATNIFLTMGFIEPKIGTCHRDCCADWRFCFHKRGLNERTSRSSIEGGGSSP